MTVWDALRRFSGFGKRKPAERSRGPHGRRRPITGSLRSRDLRMEQFEHRVLLSISPTSMDQWSFLSPLVTSAIQEATNLDRYTEADLDATQQWVVGLTGTALSSPQTLAATLGADNLGPTNIIKNTYVWEFSSQTDWEAVADRLDTAAGVAFAYPLVPNAVEKYFIPNDPLFSQQWHLQNTGQTGGTPGEDANVVLAWDSVLGNGVIIGIVDDSLQVNHPDLVGNYRADLSYDFWAGDPDPSPESGDNHGTAVAGVSAAVGNNGLGVSGAAPGAEIAGLRLTSGWPTDLQTAQALLYSNQEIDIYNNSWGAKFDFPNSWGPLTMAALEQGVANGRDGLGSIFVFAAGNGREEDHNVNLMDLQSSRFTIAVAAIDADGHYSSYSTPGAAVFISAYSCTIPAYKVEDGIVTTDRTGEDGYNRTGTQDDDSLPDINYTSTFGGTSSAAPLASGVIALMLEANPSLTYRDVQYILAETAKMNDPTDSDWQINGAGYEVSHNYGFGAIDAAAAIQAAYGWTTVGAQVSASSAFLPIGQQIPDGAALGLSSSVVMDDTVNRIEWVEVVFDASHPAVGDLEVVLISPDGTRSRLAETRANTWMFSGAYENWTFSSCMHWGESAEGTWTLEVRDRLGGDVGTWNSWQLRVYGQHEGGTGPEEPEIELVAPELVAILPNDGSQITDGDTLHIGPRELLFQFNERQVIDPATLGGIRIVRAGGDDIVGNGNDVVVEYGWIGIGDQPNEVIVRFAETLPDDLYQITIFGQGNVVLKNMQGRPFQDGTNLAIQFDLDLGAQVIAVVPQPVVRDPVTGALSQKRDTIEVYFNDDALDLDSVARPEFYRLSQTSETATPWDDGDVLPVSVVYDRAENKVVLTFAGDLATLSFDGRGGVGTLRLRIGNAYHRVETSTTTEELVGDTFATARSMGQLGSALEGESILISSIIEALPYDLPWPGAITEVGHRELISNGMGESHLSYASGDFQYGAATYYYNFGPLGSYPNIINGLQKDRVREIFEIYGTLLGVQFIEDTSGANRGFTIGTGDLRAIDPYIETGPGGVIGLAGGGMAIMDSAENWTPNERGGSWFRTAMHEIGHLLGLGHTYDMPSYTVMGVGENLDYEGEGTSYYTADSELIFPGAVDLVHGQYLYRPDGTDVDFYQFTVERDGVFSAEAVAERLADSSMLDSVLSLYDQTGRLIARNDDYYSEDAFIEIDLTPGTYYVAISASGNTSFDPDVADSGLGGTSQGKYDLRLTFLPKVLENGLETTEHLIDSTGTLFDGDADGVPGGVYNFWFTSATAANTIFVDKIAPAGGNGSISQPYREIDLALAAAQPGKVVRIVGNRDRTFEDQLTLDVSVNPTGVGVGDFDGDGRTDLAVVNEGDWSVSILYRQADGSYSLPATYDVGRNPKGIAIGDLNGDTYPDIVVTNQADRTVSLLVNTGTGTFAPQQTRAVGFTPVAVKLGDLNGDGRLDIVVANRADDTVGVLLGSATEFFRDQVVYSVGDAPADIALGEINNDGVLDIVVANSGTGDNRVSVLLGVGDGTFLPAGHVAVGTKPVGVAIGDLDGDGNADVVTANYTSNNVSILMGAGNGTFASPVSVAVGTRPSAVSLADLDDDGALDVVVANESNGTVTLLFGAGDGTVAQDPNIGPYETGLTPKGLIVADVDGDNREDIVTTSYAEDTVSLILARRDAAYEIGKKPNGQALVDGAFMEIPKGVTVMIDAGAVLKLRDAIIDVGSSSETSDRSRGALQVFGTPELSVYFSSYYDKTIGVDNGGAYYVPQPGNWGGLVFRNEIDYDVRATSDPNRVILETEGIFLNYVNHADIRYGGGRMTTNNLIYTPIQMIEARPTVSYNTIRYSANAAMSGDPNSFADTRFWGTDALGNDYITDYQRIGPDIHGNRLVQNSLNGLFVGIDTPAGQPSDELEVAARWDDLDIVHIVAQHLLISGTPGGPAAVAGTEALRARTDARLAIDPGVFVKINSSRIEAEVGAQLIAEGRAGYPVVFTSVFDDRYGAGGTFDTTNNQQSRTAAPGDWGSLFFSEMSSGSIDHAVVAYAGGTTSIEGGFGVFDPVEIHQGFVRLTNSLFEYNKGANSAGTASPNRAGRGTVEEAVIFVRGAQPILTGNVIRDNLVPAISIDANSLVGQQMTDWGRSTGELALVEEYPDNYGPLVRDNRLGNNKINGMVGRGAVLTTECVWDDTDIVHVLFEEIVIPNFHTYGGLRLQSSVDESLVVKLDGQSAGFTALGTPQDIDDRIGGTLQILGQAGFPVVLTALADDTAGAGEDPWGNPQLDTDNIVDVPVAGSWRSVKLERYMNDRNVTIVLEREQAMGLTEDANAEPFQAQQIGSLAPHSQAGDDNLALGFDVRGFIRSDDPTDADVYSFEGRAGTEVWIDIDRTTMGLDTVVELVGVYGDVIASSDNSPAEEAGLAAPYGIAMTMDADAWETGDMYTVNPHDAGMRLVLPGAAGELRTYYVRVRSAGGTSSGGYELQVRLREDQEIAGTTIQGSSIRYATNGIEVYGVPTHSPLLGEAFEIDAVLDDGTLATAPLTLAGAANDILLTAKESLAPGILGNGIIVQFVDLGNVGDVAQAQYNTLTRTLTVRIDVGTTRGITINNAINNLGNACPLGAELSEGDGAGTVSDWGLVGVTTGGANQGNDRFENAEPLGRLLTSDGSELVVGGKLSDKFDVDWYSFELDLEDVQKEGNVIWPVIFDFDYGSNLGRPDLNFYVFDADGVLIYSSTSSSVDDDQMSLANAGTDDLTRGSGGAGDPLLGPVHLPGGEDENGDPIRYYLAITGPGNTAMALVDYANPYVRNEPVNSIERIAEDHVGDSLMSGVNWQYNLLPNVDPLRPELSYQSTELNIHIDDFSLCDVTLFITNGADLGTFDPYTGTFETDVTGPGVGLANLTDWGAHYGDLAMRDDGRLMSIIDGVGLTGNVEPYVGRYRELSSGDGNLMSDQDDGITVSRLNAAQDDVEAAETGVQFTAIAHIPGDTQRRMVAIGHIPDGVPATMVGIDDTDNFLFILNADGTPISAPGVPAVDIPTNFRPWAWLNAEGKITGLAFMDGVLLAVDDLGKLYTVDGFGGVDVTDTELPFPGSDPENPEYFTTLAFGGNVTATEVADLVAVTGYDAIEFTGLAAGPQNVEPVGPNLIGAYRYTLFATASVTETDEGGITTTTSRIMTFGADGELHYCLLDGRADVELEGNPTTTGLAFSTVDYNLWHLTSNRWDDAGHGIEEAPDQSRTPLMGYREDGNYSYWFGLEQDGPQPGVANYEYGPNANSGVLNTYDVPGGAHGTLTTDTFSLVGYSSADAPKLYFTYFLQTDGGSASQVTDSARVYISSDGVNWTMLASNITTISPDASVTRLYEALHGVGDEGDYQWRQAEISLGNFAGQDNLRIKFEFSTAGSRLINEQYYYGGAYWQALPGIELRDGQTFSAYDKDPFVYADAEPITFEFDLGYSLVAPNSAGLRIEEYETFSITDAGGTTQVFQFVKSGHQPTDDAYLAVPYSVADSAGSVIESIRAAVDAAAYLDENPLVDVIPVVTGDRVFLVGAAVMEQTTPGDKPAMILDGAPGLADPTADPPNVLVPISPLMDDVAVADAIAEAMDTRFSQVFDDEGNFVSGDQNEELHTSVKTNRGLIYVRPNHLLADPGPLAYYGDFQPGDMPAAGSQGGSGTQFLWNLRGQDNAYEGFYVDDVMIGFAERGEMQTDVRPNAAGQAETFFQHAEVMGVVTTGYYQFSIRRASEDAWGVWDTNDRQGEAITIEAPPAVELVHRSTFTVSDGVHWQTFQFIARPGSGEEPLEGQMPDEGMIAISFYAGDTDADLADAIADAINSAGLLDVVASTLASKGSNRVELHGAAWVDGIETLTFDNDGQNPTAIEAVDLDPPADPEEIGTPDIIVVNEYDGTVSIIMNGGAAKIIVDVGYLPSDVAVGDFDGDGRLDLAVTNAGDDTISILLGNGDGTFDAQVTYAVGNEPVAIDTYDLDADGRLDLVAVNKADNTISILYGRGNGTFRKARTVAVGRAPMDVALGDLDGDALGDIVVANSRDNTVSVIRALMPGFYGPAETYAVGRLPVSVDIGDLNPDTKNPDAPLTLDIVTANRTDGTVSVLMGDGQGNFLPAAAYRAGDEVVHVRIIDLDPPADPKKVGVPEVTTAHFNGNVINILRSNERVTNTLGSPISWPSGSGPMASVFADVMFGDGLLDLISADYRGHTVTMIPCMAPIVFYDTMSAVQVSTGDGYLRLLQGDQNHVRDQGQLIIAANEVLYSLENGITVDAGRRDSWPHPGSAVPLAYMNELGLVPGVTIMNNLVVGSGEVGILISGDDTEGAEGAVLFARVLNNTVYGGAPPLDVEFLDPEEFEFVLPPAMDDTSIHVSDLGFTFEFYGNSFNELYVNSNGNVTFNGPQFAYTPDGFPAGEPMFAPFWADVDTSTAGEIRAGTGTSVRGNPVFQVDWIDVGYFDNHDNKTNRFTLYIEDDPAGDIVVFKYWDMQWTTADPNGINGFGGDGAEIGFDAGDGEHYISLMRPKSADDLTRLMDQGMYVFRMDPDIDTPLMAGGIGIRVTQNSSPTLLNNILANLDIGMLIDPSSASTVVGTTIYQNNTQNVAGTSLGEFAVVLGPEDPLFVDPLHGNFYLAAGSQAIDSSYDSMADRLALMSIRGPLGIPESPILAPEFDLLGQRRDDDWTVDTPPGMGGEVFKDRGAIDRVDFYVPEAHLSYPFDLGPGEGPGDDLNPAANDVFVADTRLAQFTIQLTDLDGVGIDDFSVTSDRVQIFLDDATEPLVPDKDYYFRYDKIRDVITLIPASGFWKEAATYRIVLDRGPEGIRDIAANPLRSNRLDGTTQFVVAISEFDYGDAPDPTYPSLRTSNGARHMLIGGYYLGDVVTGEKDAKLARDNQGNVLPNEASGDVGDDGVGLPSVLLIDSTATITVKASRGGGKLDAWVDFNLDGDWDDPGERIFDHLSIARGTSTLQFDVPETLLDPISGEPVALTSGQTFIRFRYSQAGVDSPYGVAATGEVEDYRIMLVDSLVDYGDAPEPYPTLLEDDGASHALGSGRMLGQTVDEELDGQPHAAALGDDLTGPTIPGGGVVNDEDGVAFLDPLSPSSEVRIVVTASMSGYLNAWVDFDGNGVWNTEDGNPEWVFKGVPLVAGTNELFINVPADAPEGLTYARFRFSSQETLLPTGHAADGEVEDYQLFVVATPSDYGDAPRTYGTVAQSSPATVLLNLTGPSNDMFLTAVTPGTVGNDIGIVFINSVASGDKAIVTFNSVSRNLVIDVDPTATRAATVVAAINDEGTFTAKLDSSVDVGNDGSGLITALGKVATTANGFDGFGGDVARHVVGSGLLLGSLIDVEYDGRPDDEALGDDNHGLDDEDGVEMPAQIVSGLVARFLVDVTMGSQVTNAYLSAWVDVNQDGTFTEDEKVIAGVPVVDGMQEVPATIPAAALGGMTFARFRLSSEQNLTSLGEAPDGEIEDYQIEITKGDAKISGWKFDDRNKNGAKDTGEPGVPGVTVFLDINGDGTLNLTEPMTLTQFDNLATPDVNETGYYEFAGLIGQTGPYVVREIVPDGWIRTYPYAGVVLPDGSWGNADGSFSVLLSASEHVTNVNFGNYRKPVVSAEVVEVAEGDDGYTYVNVTLTLQKSFNYAVTVNYSTQDGSATTADNDYRSASGSVVFPAGNPPEAVWDVRTLTSNESNDYNAYHTSGQYVVWEGFDGNDTEIYLFTGVYMAGDVPQIIQLTDNTTNDSTPAVFDAGGQPYVVWSHTGTGAEGTDTEIWFYDGTTSYAVTNNSYNDYEPQLSGSMVTWWSRTPTDDEIFVWNIGDPVTSRFNLTDNESKDVSPRISGNTVVWIGYASQYATEDKDREIFVYDGTETPGGLPNIVRLTTDSQSDSDVQIDGNLIVWQKLVGTSHEIFVHDLSTSTTTQITTNSLHDRYPQVSGTDVVWQTFTGGNWEIYHYNTEAQTAPTNISSSSYPDERPQVKDGRVVWVQTVGGKGEILTRQLRGTGAITNVSNSAGHDWSPQITDSGTIIWRAHDEEDYEIVVATANEPEVTQTITLRIVGDLKVEGDEYFYLNLSGDGSIIFENTRTEIWILNDDGDLDFGDAPAPYPTLLADNGARHLISTLYLGPTGVNLPDPETDGQPSADATGDDFVTRDDENGIQFVAPLAIGSPAQIVVTASGMGYLDAWMDFNRDGDWDDEGEQIFLAEPVAAGSNALSINVPGWAVAGDTFARFRLSSFGYFPYTGCAEDGEVEDYKVSLTSGSAAASMAASPPEEDGAVALSATAAAVVAQQPVDRLSQSVLIGPVFRDFSAGIPTPRRLEISEPHQQYVVWADTFEARGGASRQPVTPPAMSAADAVRLRDWSLTELADEDSGPRSQTRDWTRLGDMEDVLGHLQAWQDFDHDRAESHSTGQKKKRAAHDAALMAILATGGDSEEI